MNIILKLTLPEVLKLTLPEVDAASRSGRGRACLSARGAAGRRGESMSTWQRKECPARDAACPISTG